MGAKTEIEWADATWNPWQGCTPVSEGCENCYMYAAKRRYGQDPTKIARSSDKTFNMPLSLPAGQRVFVCSWSDFLHERVPDAWRIEALRIMVERDDLTFMILTKRARRAGWLAKWAGVCPNVWIGVTTENQRRADERIPALLRTPAALRFVSVEPMLDRMDLGRYLGVVHEDIAETMNPDGGAAQGAFFHNPWMEGIDWVIVGGETGPKARPMDPDWARAVRDQCKEAGVPFFFKQMAERAPIPEDLMVREFPKEKKQNDG
jgi:protein gp37